MIYVKALGSLVVEVYTKFHPGTVPIDVPFPDPGNELWLVGDELKTEKLCPNEGIDSETINPIDLLNAKIDAQSQRTDFIEDCMAELAIQAYQ